MNDFDKLIISVLLAVVSIAVLSWLYGWDEGYRYGYNAGLYNCTPETCSIKIIKNMTQNGWNFVIPLTDNTYCLKLRYMCSMPAFNDTNDWRAQLGLQCRWDDNSKECLCLKR